MPQKGQGPFQKSGQSALRENWRVLKAVRKLRGSTSPSWNEYVKRTNNGRKDYSKKP